MFSFIEIEIQSRSAKRSFSVKTRGLSFSFIALYTTHIVSKQFKKKKAWIHYNIQWPSKLWISEMYIKSHIYELLCQLLFSLMWLL